MIVFYPVPTWLLLVLILWLAVWIFLKFMRTVPPFLFYTAIVLSFPAIPFLWAWQNRQKQRKKATVIAVIWGVVYLLCLLIIALG
jgi:hypothetical protein